MPELPAATYQQPLPAIVDEVARQLPDKVFLSIAKYTTSRDGEQVITFKDAQRIIDRIAAWLDRTLGKADGFPAYAFMAQNFDVRYVFFAIASVKTGHKIFLPSPRNSEDFHIHLINKLGVKHIVSSLAVGPYAEKTGCTVIEPPSLDELLAAGDFTPYAYSKTLEQSLRDPIITMHSSGSTGPPKPITWTNGYIEATRKLTYAPQNNDGVMDIGFTSVEGGMMAMPFFHTAGLLASVCAIVLFGSPMTAFPIDAIVNAQTAVDFINTFNISRGMIPPSVCEDIAKDEQLLARLDGLPMILFGGAAVSEDAGEKISKHTHLISCIGSTEASLYPVLMPTEQQEAYSWLRIEPLDGFTLREQDDGLAELVIERSDIIDWPVFHAFPDIAEYATNDLYQKHPTLSNTWKMVGRKDDVLVLSNGEKVVPIPMEDVFRSSPDVTGALYFGHGKFSTGILIELTDAAAALPKDELVRRLRPYALRSNEIAPAFARLTEAMIIFTSREKPMRRAPKGSTLRRPTLAQYTEEIDAAYLKAEAGTAVPLVKDLTEEQTQQALIDIFSSLTNKDITLQEDLFQSAGVDSMQVIEATRNIKASAQAEAPQVLGKVSTPLVYNNPTVKQLTQAVRSLFLTGKVISTRDATAEMQAMLDKYSEAIPQAVPLARSGGDGKFNVVLTGSTGSLGSYLLSLMIENPAVGTVYALNRGDDSSERQLESNASRGLSTDLRKVVFLKASLGNKNLGLSTQDYQTLVSSAHLIIHNAWPVNFNQSLESFEPHIRGVRNFVDLSAASSLRPHITFISSIGTTNAWELFYPDQKRPETIIDDSRPAQGGGYGEGKWVGEHLVAAAAAKGISSTVARVGQVAGPVERAQGQWNRQEWLPSIIFSSAHMGKLPTSLGSAPTNWIPVDSMAKIVTELSFHDLAASPAGGKVGNTDVYNLTNPTDNGWESLVEGIKTRLSIKEVVSWDEWVQAVRADSDDDSTNAAEHPAVKLIDFYEVMATEAVSSGYETDRAVATSEAVAALHGVDNEWMERWMTQWGF